MKRPHVFIGSSSEGLPVARVVHELLSDVAEVRTWPEAFRPSSTYIETLEKQDAWADFAILLLTDDDAIVSRAGRSKAPRDNVVFELGLFIGCIGRERCYVLHEKSVKLPSDLAGMKNLSFACDGALSRRAFLLDNDAMGAALEQACVAIRALVKELGPRPAKIPHYEIESWAAARQFARSIEGCWWSLRNWDDKTIGFVELGVDRWNAAMPRVNGKVFATDGRVIARWDSEACCVLARERRLYYYFTGRHTETKETPLISKEGFSEYTFDIGKDRPDAGTGVFSDRDLALALGMERRSLELRRCTSEEVEVMKSNNAARIAALIVDVLKQARPQRA